MKETSDKQLYERYLAVRLRLDVEIFLAENLQQDTYEVKRIFNELYI